MAGRTEKYIGSWLAKGSVKRENLVIATKVSGPGRAFLPHNRGQTHKSASSLERDQIRAAAQASIQRMGCSYLDILYLHWPERPCCNFGRTVFNPERAESANPVPFEEQVQGMKELYDEGIIRGWALSNETAYGVTMHCEAAKKLNAPLPCAHIRV
jgi:aryl-alcohol dehydrogenase-like predicted oxidoreductase